MPTYLYIHPEASETPQALFRDRYPIRTFDFEFSRDVDRRGEIVSGIHGGSIRVVLEGFADANLLAWIFDPIRKESGEIRILDEFERNLGWVRFKGASVCSYRLHYDSRIKEGVTLLLAIWVKELVTDGDVYFEKK